MSLHLNQQCQRADTLPRPVRVVPGIGYTDQEEARNERETSVGGRVRLLEGHIWVTLLRVNGFLQFCCSGRFSSAELLAPQVQHPRRSV